MAESLPNTVISVLEDFQVPVPTGWMREICTARRGAPVTAEALSRLAAAQRDEFVRRQLPPRLCHAIDEHARAPVPRIWALGSWRLARRIRTPDALGMWRNAVAFGLCQEMVRIGGRAGGGLPDAAQAAVAQALGPLAAHRPADLSGWEELVRRLAGRLPGAGLAAHTQAQASAEAHLQGLSLPAVSVYFGVPDEAPPSRPPTHPAAVRLPVPGEQPEPFDEVMLRRVSGDRSSARRLGAFLQAWSHLADHLGRPPSSAEFADRWRQRLDDVHLDERLFLRAFPEESTPGPLVELLWSATPTQGDSAWLLGVPVVDLGERGSQPVVPAVGQRWLRSGGEGWLTITEIQGDQVVGGLYDARSETTSLWAGTRGALADFELEQPQGLFLAGFDVDVLPMSLTGVLQQAGIVATRLSRPGDPRSDRLPSVGHIEVQVEASDEADAREKIIRALEGHQALTGSDVAVRPLARSSAR